MQMAYEIRGKNKLKFQCLCNILSLMHKLHTCDAADAIFRFIHFSINGFLVPLQLCLFTQ